MEKTYFQMAFLILLLSSVTSVQGKIGRTGVEEMKLLPRKLQHYSSSCGVCIYNFDCLRSGCGNICVVQDPDMLFGKCKYR
ncbi:hypothetical protein CDL12_01293 [Handroanthus impetiginosus]|uniref:Uncharacterized protein n=1 Tax=Handroanthus impetiginosus TaxID=429701 RepID=A0A2G9I868_9LAMI|nr:hypothetical protein CDL12_01293 [Handroanthus impetiginosus]